MIRTIWGKYRQMHNQRMLESLVGELHDPKSDISHRVELKAKILATKMMMNWLNAKRIRHCKYCAGTDTLRSNGDDYYCRTHFVQISQS